MGLRRVSCGKILIPCDTTGLTEGGGGHVNTSTFCILPPQMGTYFFKILNGGKPGRGRGMGTDLGWGNVPPHSYATALCDTHVREFNLNDCTFWNLKNSDNPGQQSSWQNVHLLNRPPPPPPPPPLPHKNAVQYAHRMSGGTLCLCDVCTFLWNSQQTETIRWQKSLGQIFTPFPSLTTYDVVQLRYADKMYGASFWLHYVCKLHSMTVICAARTTQGKTLIIWGKIYN